MSEILDEKVVFCGGIKKIKRYWSGVHPDKGKIIHGLTGWETLEEREVFIPLHVFNVAAESINHESV